MKRSWVGVTSADSYGVTKTMMYEISSSTLLVCVEISWPPLCCKLVVAHIMIIRTACQQTKLLHKTLTSPATRALTRKGYREVLASMNERKDNILLQDRLDYIRTAENLPIFTPEEYLLWQSFRSKYRTSVVLILS
jgi:hypothetical protein